MVKLILVLATWLNCPAKPVHCDAALSAFPVSRDKRYTSGFTLHAQKEYELKEASQKLKSLGRGLGELKVQELVGRLHELAYHRKQLVLIYADASARDLAALERTHPEWADQVDRAVSKIARLTRGALHPYFDELRVILGDLNSWYPQGYARVTLLAKLCEMTEVFEDYADNATPLLKHLSTELAELGPALTRGQLELLKATSERRAALSSGSHPGKRLAFTTELIREQMKRLERTPSRAGQEYLEHLIEQLPQPKGLDLANIPDITVVESVLEDLLARARYDHSYLSLDEGKIEALSLRLAIPARRAAE